jgi:hypothetical protein
METVAEAAVRATIIALGIGSILAVLRLQSPRVRHLAWTGLVVLMLLLPAAGVWAPQIPLHILNVEAAGWLPPPASPDAAAVPISPPPFTAPVKQRAPLFAWTSAFAVIYATGMTLLLVRFIFGLRRSRTIRREAVSVKGRLTHPACVTPMTIGLFKPAVILPPDWRRWDRRELAAVLAHEDEHVRRRDPLIVALTLLNRAVFWFHPLAWWLHGKVATLAEQSSDLAVVSGGHDATRYAACLVRFARRASAAGSRLAPVAMTMPGSGLGARLGMISRPPVCPSRARLLCGVAAYVAIAVAGAVAAPAAVRAQVRPNAAPPRDATTAWSVFTSDHFEILHDQLPEQEVRETVRLAEIAYAQLSGALLYELRERVPVILLQRSSDLRATDAQADRIAGLSGAPRRPRIVLSLELGSRAIVHELTHAFAFEIVPETSRIAPVVIEGLAWQLSGVWSASDLNLVRDGALSGTVPGVATLGPSDVAWAHAVFEFVASRYGEEGIRRLLFALRAHSTLPDAIPMAFGSGAEFDRAFRTFITARFRQ